MAGEFTRENVNGERIWRCNDCGEGIKNDTKPRGHICRINYDNANNPAAQSSTAPQVPPPFPNHQNGAVGRFATPPGPMVNNVWSQFTPRFSRGRGRSGGF